MGRGGGGGGGRGGGLCYNHDFACTYADVGGAATNFMIGIILVTAVSSGVILLLVVTIFTFIYYYIHKCKSGFTLETNTSYGKIYALKIQKEFSYYISGKGGISWHTPEQYFGPTEKTWHILSHGNGSQQNYKITFKWPVTSCT